MSLKSMIFSDYQERLSLSPDIPSGLRDALKNHERVPLFVDNLVKELNLIPASRKLDRIKIKNLVYQMTDLFINNAKQAAEDKYKSEIEKHRLQALGADPFELDKQGNGSVEDLGVKISDGTD